MHSAPYHFVHAFHFFFFLIPFFFLNSIFSIKQNYSQYVDKYGLNKCIEMALDHIDPKNERDYHISFDIDALDRHETPSTGIPRKCINLIFDCHWKAREKKTTTQELFNLSFFNYSSRWFIAAWRHQNNWQGFWEWTSAWIGFGWSLSEYWRC